MIRNDVEQNGTEKNIKDRKGNDESYEKHQG